MGAALLTTYGLPALFGLSCLAATLIPVGSEAGVVLLVLSGLDPVSIWATATLGNTAGAGINYVLGRWGARFWRRHRPHPPSAAWRRARRRIRRWGAPVLFFAWAPIVGDPLTLAAGGLKIPLGPFLAWVFLGKALRYWLVIESARWAAR
jgi:membrane protein YqaA with SNARE-associated domain